jgi:hypothetical protein
MESMILHGDAAKTSSSNMAFGKTVKYTKHIISQKKYIYIHIQQSALKRNTLQ